MKEWNGYKPGDKVVMLIQTMGETPDGEEVVYSADTPAEICAVRHLGPKQGWGVEVLIGEEDRTIVNVFDDADLAREGLVWFRKA